jgi:thioredoxin
MGIQAMPAGDKVATVEVTQENFNQVVNGNSMVIVDFWAPWCGPCRSFAPAYEAASEKHPDVVFAKVNTEEQQALAGYFQIRSIPTLMIFRDKIIIFAQPGALPAAALEQVIEKAKALDMDEVRREIAAEKNQQAPAG